MLYQHGWPALTLDCTCKALRRRRASTSALSALLLAPAIYFPVSASSFGHGAPFAIAASFTAALVELRRRRERTATRHPAETFIVKPPAIAVTIGSFVLQLAPAVILLFFAASNNQTLRGWEWGVAFALLLDGLATGIAFVLALGQGAPIYPRAFRWIHPGWETSGTVGRIKELPFYSHAARAAEFAAWARDHAHDARFVAMQWDEPGTGESLMFVWTSLADHPGWIANKRFGLPIKDELPASVPPDLPDPYAVRRRHKPPAGV